MITFLILPGRKGRIISAILSGFLLLSMLQGCLSSSKTPDQPGTLTGSIPLARNLNLIASRNDMQTVIPIDASGNFRARLEPGVYQLYLQTEAGDLTLIRKTVNIENNISVSVVDADLIPIPQVKSVSVPLVYNTSATIEWETDIESDGYVEFGTNELYGYSSYATTELKTRHRMQLFNLLPATTYHFRVVASRYNLESARSITRNFTFTTEP